MSAHIEPQVYDIASFCKAYSISRSFAYLEIKAGRLKPFKAGRKTLISREAAEAWRRLLESSGIEAASAPTIQGETAGVFAPGIAAR